MKKSRLIYRSSWEMMTMQIEFIFFTQKNNVWFVPEDIIKRHEIKEEEQ